MPSAGSRGGGRTGQRGSLGQQTAGDSVLPQPPGVMHVPAQHAWLVPQLSWPVGPANDSSRMSALLTWECVTLRSVAKTAASVLTPTTSMRVCAREPHMWAWEAAEEAAAEAASHSSRSCRSFPPRSMRRCTPPGELRANDRGAAQPC